MEENKSIIEDETYSDKSMHSPFIYRADLKLYISASKKGFFKSGTESHTKAKIIAALKEYGFLTVRLISEIIGNTVSDDVLRRHLKELTESGILLRFQPYYTDAATGHRKNRVIFFGLSNAIKGANKTRSIFGIYSILAENQLVIFAKKHIGDSQDISVKKCFFTNGGLLPYRFCIQVRGENIIDRTYIYCISIRTANGFISSYLTKLGLVINANKEVDLGVIAAVDSENTAYRCELARTEELKNINVYYVLDVDMIKEGGPLNNLFIIKPLEYGYDKKFVAITDSKNTSGEIT